MTYEFPSLQWLHQVQISSSGAKGDQISTMATRTLMDPWNPHKLWFNLYGVILVLFLFFFFCWLGPVCIIFIKCFVIVDVDPMAYLNVSWHIFHAVMIKILSTIE